MWQRNFKCFFFAYIFHLLLLYLFPSGCCLGEGNALMLFQACFTWLEHFAFRFPSRFLVLDKNQQAACLGLAGSA